MKKVADKLKLTMDCEAIVRSVELLMARHAAEIKTVQADSEDNKVKVAFSCGIDGSEAEPLVKTTIKFSATVSDSVTAKLDTRGQGSFEFVDDEETADGDVEADA